MKRLLNISAALVLAASCSISSALRTESAAIPSKSYDLSFGLKLLKQMAGSKEKANTIVSPASAYILLGMLANGAKGETEKQLLQAMGDKASLDDLNKEFQALKQAKPAGNYTLESANAVYVDKCNGLENGFIQSTKPIFNAEAHSENFADPAVVTKINQFCKDHTHGKIPTILEHLSREDQIVLINALYFKGKWLSEFTPQATQMRPFTTGNGEKTQTLMMTQEHEFAYAKAPTFAALKMPYVGNEVSMVVLLPDQKSALKEVIATLSPTQWKQLTASYQKELVDVQMPKFKIEMRRQLEGDLVALGIKDAFDEKHADFSKMLAHKGHIGAVIQKTYVDVNEEGTEAAAVTAAVGSKDMFSGPQPKQFHVNRPFAFALMNDKTGQMLFVGAINDPSGK